MLVDKLAYSAQYQSILSTGDGALGILRGAREGTVPITWQVVVEEARCSAQVSAAHGPDRGALNSPGACVSASVCVKGMRVRARVRVPTLSSSVAHKHHERI